MPERKRPERNMIQDILPKKRQRCCLGFWCGKPPSNKTVKFFIGLTPIYFWGLNRPDQIYGDNSRSVPVFGYTISRKRVFTKDWQDLPGSICAVLAERKDGYRQITLLIVEGISNGPDILPILIHFRKTRRVGKYRLAFEPR